MSVLSLDHLVADSFGFISHLIGGQELVLKKKFPIPTPNTFGSFMSYFSLSESLLRFPVPDPRPISYFDHVPLAAFHHSGQTPCLGLA